MCETIRIAGMGSHDTHGIKVIGLNFSHYRKYIVNHLHVLHQSVLYSETADLSEDFPEAFTCYYRLLKVT